MKPNKPINNKKVTKYKHSQNWKQRNQNKTTKKNPTKIIAFNCQILIYLTLSLKKILILTCCFWLVQVNVHDGAGKEYVTEQISFISDSTLILHLGEFCTSGEWRNDTEKL